MKKKTLYKAKIEIAFDALFYLPLNHPPEGDKLSVKWSNPDIEEPHLYQTSAGQFFLEFAEKDRGKITEISIIRGGKQAGRLFLGKQKGNTYLPKKTNASFTHDFLENIASFNIPDFSFLRILNHFEGTPANKYHTFAGVHFSSLLAFLYAYGLDNQQIKQAFREQGVNLAHRNVLRFTRTVLLREDRNEFTHLSTFVKKLIPNADEIQIKDLQANVFIPIKNLQQAALTFISKQETPELPLLDALQFAMAFYLDFRPKEISKNLPEKEEEYGYALSHQGSIWNEYALGNPAVDLSLLETRQARNMNITSFSTRYFISPIKAEKIRDGKEIYTHICAKNESTNRVLNLSHGIMSSIPSIRYSSHILDPVPYRSSLSKEEIQLVLQR